MNFGHAIKTARMCANWSIEKLAENAGLSASEISLIEDEGANVSKETEKAIAKAFDISTWSLKKLGADQEERYKQTTLAQIALIKAAIAIRHFKKSEAKNPKIHFSQSKSDYS
jgi:transcriptional regulator with XRE-family HTH domain